MVFFLKAYINILTLVAVYPIGGCVHIWVMLVPEFVSDEDNSPLQQNGGEHLQESPYTETLEQAVEVHVL